MMKFISGRSSAATTIAADHEHEQALQAMMYEMNAGEIGRPLL
jgi:hypothetical protein